MIHPPLEIYYHHVTAFRRVSLRSFGIGIFLVFGLWSDPSTQRVGEIQGTRTAVQRLRRRVSICAARRFRVEEIPSRAQLARICSLGSGVRCWPAVPYHHTMLPLLPLLHLSVLPTFPFAQSASAASSWPYPVSLPALLRRYHHGSGVGATAGKQGHGHRMY